MILCICYISTQAYDLKADWDKSFGLYIAPGLRKDFVCTHCASKGCVLTSLQVHVPPAAFVSYAPMDLSAAEKTALKKAWDKTLQASGMAGALKADCSEARITYFMQVYELRPDTAVSLSVLTAFYLAWALQIRLILVFMCGHSQVIAPHTCKYMCG